MPPSLLTGSQENRPRSLPSLRSISIAATILFALLLLNAAILKQNLDTLVNHQSWVAHTHEVISKLKELTASMRAVESGQRGFALTAAERFLDTHEQGRSQADEQLRALLSLTLDNASQQVRLKELAARIAANFAYHRRVIQTVRTEGRDAARAIVERGEGREAIADMDRMVSEILEVELNLLTQRNSEATSSQARVNQTFFLGTLTSLLLVILGFVAVRRYLNRELSDRAREERESFVKTGLANLSSRIVGETSVQSLCEKVLNFLGERMRMELGTIYVATKDAGGGLLLAASYAGAGTLEAKDRLQLGEGLLGEAFKQGKVISVAGVPKSFSKVRSSLGEAWPQSLLLIPIGFEDQTLAVIELGTFGEFKAIDLELGEAVRNLLGASLAAVQQRTRMQQLLEETQLLAEELQTQQEELRVANEELESQSQAAIRANDLLSEQKEELRQINEHLAMQTTLLEEKQQALAIKNSELEQSSQMLLVKAHELETASRYKSDFLANMSHELRTPLNSLLILSTLLYENREGNLNEKQIDFAKTIHRSGNDLLALINDILDLSKIEAGRVDLVIDKVHLPEFLKGIDNLFRPLTEQKGLSLVISMEPELRQQALSTDRLRLEQILKNLVSNAVKFTHQGEVRLLVHKAQSHGTEGLNFVVADTGVGIAFDKQDVIFEAFQQADTSTSRQYGGTGLGLTISRELAGRLGGSIEVRSEMGKGSQFTLFIPSTLIEGQPGQEQVISQGISEKARPAPLLPIAKENLQNRAEPEPDEQGEQLIGDLEDDSARRVLVIEDDLAFGKTLLDIAHENGFKAVLATKGEVGLAFARKGQVVAILLDLRLPDVSGMSILERLKNDSKTRHLPIHIVSSMDFSQTALKMGAFGYLTKPAGKHQLDSLFQRLAHLLSRNLKKILIVEDDLIQLSALRELLSGSDVEIDSSSTGAAALERMRVGNYDCMILDLHLPDISGFELLERLQSPEFPSRPPVVVYTGKDLIPDEERELSRYAESIIIKGARSPERLMDEVSLFLHRIEKNLPQDKQTLLHRLREKDDILDGRRVLIVDDDMRNVFALTNALEQQGLECVVARNGLEALKKLEVDTAIEIVLMDIMMPVMDGFEAMQKIRENPNWRKLPIISLTAKAMKGDEEKCLKAGANDYLMKPIKLDKLISLLKVWLPGRIRG